MIFLPFLSPVGDDDLPDVPFVLWTPNSSRTSRSACSGSRRVAGCGAVSWTWRSCSARLATLHSCPRPAMAARSRLHSTTGRLSCASAFATRCARRAMRCGGAPPAAGVTPTVPHLLEEQVGPADQWASAAWLAGDHSEPLPLLRQVWPQLGPSNRAPHGHAVAEARRPHDRRPRAWPGRRSPTWWAALRGDGGCPTQRPCPPVHRCCVQQRRGKARHCAGEAPRTRAGGAEDARPSIAQPRLTPSTPPIVPIGDSS